METVQVLHLGCVSSVFLASKQTPDQDQKVVKAYHKGHLQVRHWLNITREVTHLRQLKELGVPGVVDLCGTADDAQNVYLVFEPCFGGDLYKRLAHRGLYDEAKLCKEVVVPLLRVLQSLHQMGIVHRDIKPENIFFENDGTLRLGDFGLAINATKERPISRVGTLDYMAPEVLAQPSADVIHARKIKSSELPSYDCKVDIWALGVLVYEALMGVTPFGDTDQQAASLKAQFRPPMPLPSAVSAGCADFVAQALSKQAAKRPSAADLLAHPWVQRHMGAQEVQSCLERALSGRAASGSMVGSESPFNAALPGCAWPLPPASIVLSQVSSRCLPCSSSSSCDLSSSAPTASPAVLSTASSFGAPFGLQLSPGAGGLSSMQPAPLAQPKPQPVLTQPQQLPPHPFAAAAAQFGTARSLAPFLSATCTDSRSVSSACSTSALQDEHAAQRGGLPASLSIPMPQCPPKPNTVRFARQLSSPARLRDPRLSQETVTPPPGSPPPASSGGRLSYLAMSPVRALLGAHRHLVRSRSGAAAPAADGSVVVPPAKQHLSHSMSTGCTTASMRAPLSAQANRPAVMLSPIRSLLQSNRRRQPSQPSSVSLFAAAQWRPSGIAVTTSLPPLIPSITGSRASSNSSSGGGGGGGVPSSTDVCSTEGHCPSGSSLVASKSLDCTGFMRSCSMGPNVVLGAGLCNTNSSSSTVQDLSDARAGPGLVSGSSSSTAVAAVAAMGPQPSRRAPALAGNHCPGGSGEHQKDPVGHKQQLALLNRYPSAPDPWLLALSPVRGMTKVAGMPPAAAPVDRAASQGMRGMWLKVKGACRISPKLSPLEPPPTPQDGQCVVCRSP